MNRVHWPWTSGVGVQPGGTSIFESGFSREAMLTGEAKAMVTIMKETPRALVIKRVMVVLAYVKVSFTNSLLCEKVALELCGFVCSLG